MASTDDNTPRQTRRATFWRKIVAVHLLIAAAYVGSYALLVERGPFVRFSDFVTTTLGNENLEFNYVRARLMPRIPVYRYGHTIAATLFRPIHSLDTELRYGYWRGSPRIPQSLRSTYRLMDTISHHDSLTAADEAEAGPRLGRLLELYDDLPLLSTGGQAIADHIAEIERQGDELRNWWATVTPE